MKDGLNFYSYAANNPLRFVDPSGHRPTENVNSVHSSGSTGSNTNTVVTTGTNVNNQAQNKSNNKPTVSNSNQNVTTSNNNPPKDDPLYKEIKSRIGQEYALGNRCDDFTENSLKAADKDTEGLYAGSTLTHSVAQHISTGKENNTLNNELTAGWNLVFMDSSPNNFDPHAGLLWQSENGTVIFYDSSSSNKNRGVTEHYPYPNKNAFEAAYGYSKFYYQSIK